MSESDPTHLTTLLNLASSGDQEALNRLASAVYPELKRIAASRMRRERADHTLQPTALVNEAYARLLGSEPIAWQNRAHFFAVMARQMRFILVDHARRKQRGVPVAFSLDGIEGAEALATIRTDEDLVVLNEALHKLEKIDPRASQGVELRFFGGLTQEEIAIVQKKDVATIKRDWVFAKSWLYSYLSQTPPSQP